MPPLAPKIMTDSLGLRPSVSSKPRSAVMASTGRAPACLVVSLPGMCDTSSTLTAAYSSVETALGIHQAESVDAVAWLEPLDAVADCRDDARAIGAKHIGKLRLDAEYLGEAALALERVPLTHTGPLDLDQHLIGADLGHWKSLQFHRLKTAETIERDRLHCALRCLFHGA